MAFLHPENIPSRNDIPNRLQMVARCLRDLLPDDVTVWLERTRQGEDGALRKDFGDSFDGDDDGEERGSYLVVLDPSAGIAVLEAPARIRVRFRSKAARVERSKIADLTAQRASVLRHNLDSRSIRALPVVNVLALPDTSASDARKLRAELPVLCAEDFTQESLRPALRQIMGGRDHRLGEADEAAARAAVNPEIVIRGVQQEMFAPPAAGDEEILRTLDRRQERLAQNLGPGYRMIRGVAGSGKTLVLTHRAAYMASRFPRWRILLVCFNKALSQALKQQVKQCQNVEVYTVDALALRVLNPTKRSGTQEGRPNFEKRRRDAVEAARALDDAKQFDMVLVDEAQDLDSSGLDLTWAMLKTGRDHFVMALDSAQSIYRRRMSWNPPERTARGRTTVLDVNYRNTQEVLDLARQLLIGTDQTAPRDDRPDNLDVLVMPEKALRIGFPPTTLACADIAGEARAIAKTVKRLRVRGVPADHIAVLIGSEELRPELMRLLPEAMDTKSRQNRDILASAEGKVRVATLGLLKGLEFRHVIVGGANDIWVRGDDTGKEAQQRRLLYVALTRATETLTVTFSGDGLMSAISGAPKFQAN